MIRAAYLAASFLLLALPCRAEHFRIAIASDDDLYIGDILKFALDAEGGGHTVEIVRVPAIAQARALRALEDGTAAYDVIYSAYENERGKRLAMVPFPLTRGMLGYRVLAIREDRQSKLPADITFDELKSKVCFGAGNDWPDANIMRRAGLCVVTGTDESLWPMLVRGRYQAFPRGLIEFVSEMRQEAHRFRETTLTLDSTVMLAYRQDLFFFLAKKKAAEAAIIQTGLEKAHADGSYDRFFYSIPTISKALDEVLKHQRTTFHLGSTPENEMLTHIPSAYWYHFEDTSTFAHELGGEGRRD